MKRIVCEECRRVYDFDRDEFCPRCGAFNQPVKTWGVDAQGNVIRVDGVSERNHAESFVHNEVHREKAVRRALGMDWNRARAPRRTEKSAARPRNGNRALLWAALVIGFFTLVLPLLAGLIDLLF